MKDRSKDTIKKIRQGLDKNYPIENLTGNILDDLFDIPRSPSSRDMVKNELNQTREDEVQAIAKRAETIRSYVLSLQKGVHKEDMRNKIGYKTVNEPAKEVGLSDILNQLKENKPKEIPTEEILGQLKKMEDRIEELKTPYLIRLIKTLFKWKRKTKTSQETQSPRKK